MRHRDLRDGFRAGLLCAVLGAACHSRVEQRPYSRCGEFGGDSLRAGPITQRASSTPGELRVRAAWRPDTSIRYQVLIQGTRLGAITDTVAVFRPLAAGQYRLRVQTIGFERRDFTVQLPADSGRFVHVPLRRMGRSMCADGVVQVRRPWWKFW